MVIKTNCTFGFRIFLKHSKELNYELYIQIYNMNTKIRNLFLNKQK